MEKGIVVKFNVERGFGFIRSKAFPDDIFVHIREIKERQNLSLGQKTKFNVKKTDKGLMAVHVIPGNKQTSPFLIYGIAAVIVTLTLLLLLRIKYNWNAIFAYIAAINVSTFLFYFYDKKISSSSLLRVPEAILHALVICGGTPAGIFGMIKLRHKSNKYSFAKIYIIIITVQVAILLYLIPVMSYSRH